MNHRLVFQPAELRCRSDKLSAVNIERRCGEEQAGGLGDAPRGGRRRLGGTEGGAIPVSCMEQLPSSPFSWHFSSLSQN